MVRLTQRSTTAEVPTICTPISTSSLLIVSYVFKQKPKQHFKSFILFICFQTKNQTNTSNLSKIRTCSLTQWIFELGVPCDAMCAHFLPLGVYSFFQTKNQNNTSRFSKIPSRNAGNVAEKQLKSSLKSHVQSIFTLEKVVNVIFFSDFGPK